MKTEVRSDGLAGTLRAEGHTHTLAWLGQHAGFWLGHIHALTNQLTPVLGQIVEKLRIRSKLKIESGPEGFNQEASNGDLAEGTAPGRAAEFLIV